MCQSFSTMGSSSAEREIEEAENSPPTSSIRSEIKPFTTKVEAHVIEAMDLVASSMGVSRNTLVVKLINQYLFQAFYDYNEGRHFIFKHLSSNMDQTSEQYVLDVLKNIVSTSEISEQAQSYLERGVVDLVVEGL